MTKTRNRLEDIWTYLIVFCVIYFSKDTLLFGTNIDNRFALLLYISTPVMIIGVFAYGVILQAQLQKNMWFVMGMLCMFAITTQIVAEDSINLKYIYECLLYVLAFLICTVIPVKQFKKAFVDVVAFLAVFSVFTFVLKYVFPGIINSLPMITNTSGYKYGFAGLAVIPHDMAYVTFRNYGIFREPGVYQFFLNLAVILLLNDEDGVIPWKLYSLLLALVFTFSTTGYLILGAITVIYVFSNNKKKSMKMIAVIAMGLLILLYLFSEGIIRYDRAIFSKLFTSNSSLNSRVGSFVVNIYMGLQKPFFGNGFEYVEQNFNIVAFTRLGISRMANTNTILKLFAVHGIGIPTIVMLGITKFAKKNVHSKWILYSLVIFAMLSSEESIANVLTYIMLLYGFANVEEKSGEITTD